MPNQILGPDHPLWAEFTDRLSGAEGCNFHMGESGKWEWKCDGTVKHSIEIIEKMREAYGNYDLDVTATLTYFRANGGCCDCEVLFNVTAESERYE